MTLEEARAYFINDRFAMVTTGIEIAAVDKNYSKCTLAVDERHMAVGNHIMGGAIFTLADFAFAVASNDGEQITLTTSSNICYLGQAKDSTLIAECKCVKNGRTTCYFETNITDGLGNKVALVTNSGLHLSK